MRALGRGCHEQRPRTGPRTSAAHSSEPIPSQPAQKAQGRQSQQAVQGEHRGTEGSAKPGGSSRLGDSQTGAPPTSGSPAKPSRRGGLEPGGIRNPVQPEQCAHLGPPGHEHTAVPILQMGTLRTGAETPAWVRPEGGPWFSGPEPLFRNILPPPVTWAGGRRSWKPQACSQTRKLRVPPMLIRAIRCLFGN